MSTYHLIFPSWFCLFRTVLQYLHLNEEETNSSKRIFIKIVFKEIAEFLGLKKLNDRLNVLTLPASFPHYFSRCVRGPFSVKESVFHGRLILPFLILDLLMS